MSEGDLVSIGNGELRVEVSPLGAELQRVQDEGGQDWLWDGDPDVWKGRAPLLFPIVGALARSGYRLGDQTYALPKHGFARTSRFELIERSNDTVTFRLQPNAETRAVYPFEFELLVRHSVAGAALSSEVTVVNHGGAPMPASVGYHPAIRWPVPGAGVREEHVIRFDAPEPSTLRGVTDDGLIATDSLPSPVEGDTLRLRDDLFARDALVWEATESRGLWFGIPGQPGVRATWNALPSLALWTKPGARYLCIEPWQGHADPEGFGAEIWDKPGILHLAPGQARRFAMTLVFGVQERFGS